MMLRGAEYVEQVFLLQIIGGHEFFQRGDGTVRLQGIVTLFEVFNQQGKQVSQALLSSTQF